jgi:hypothetical protein
MRREKSPVANVARELERGRESYKRHAWADAYKSLSCADDLAPLGVEDLERLAMSAYLIARDDDYLRALNRAYLAHLDAGETARGVRCAFWLDCRFCFGERRAARRDGWPVPTGFLRVRNSTA